VAPASICRASTALAAKKAFTSMPVRAVKAASTLLNASPSEAAAKPVRRVAL
jgi:hypothetical protein